MGLLNEKNSFLEEKQEKQDINKTEVDTEILPLIKEIKKKNEQLISNSISLNNVKSSYILKHILSLLYEKRKLNLLIYNKKLKKKLGINLDKYKSISGKIIFGKRNGNGIEFKLGNNY